MQMTDGTTTDSYDYTAWGGMVTGGTNFHNPYVYTGREAAENGLYYYRARYYLPEVGRFGSVFQKVQHMMAMLMGVGNAISDFLIKEKLK